MHYSWSLSALKSKEFDSENGIQPMLSIKIGLEKYILECILNNCKILMRPMHKCMTLM